MSLSSIIPRSFPSFRWLLVGAVVVLVVLWLAPTIAAFFADIDIGGLDHPHLLIFSFVVLAGRPGVPNSRPLLRGAIGRTLGASYTCTGLLALLYEPLKRSWDEADPEPLAEAATD